MVGYVGVGSNLGRRRLWLREAVGGLERAGLAPLALSSVWETEPVGVRHSRWFLNMVLAVPLDRGPLAALEGLLEIERGAGRTREVPQGPRTLDLDLLLWGDARWLDDRLELPHPRMWQRRFVLEPLREIAPGLRNPASGRTVAEECRRLRGDAIVRAAGPLDLAGIIRPSTRTSRSAARHEVQIDRR